MIRTCKCGKVIPEARLKALTSTSKPILTRSSAADNFIHQMRIRGRRPFDETPEKAPEARKRGGFLGANTKKFLATTRRASIIINAK